MKHLLITPFVLMLLTTAAVAQSDAQKAIEKPKAEPAHAQSANAQDNPLSGFNKFVYGYLKSLLLRTAEKMPEENYNFKPTIFVRSFGQVVQHVADTQYYFCSGALDGKEPAPKIDPSKASKADHIAALKDAFAYCDKAYDGMTDASGAQMVKFMGTDMPKLGLLNINIIHSVEHYGNLVVYMRLKNVLPPTSEANFASQANR
jgi:uncharacterized damage-inducible protein DinB